MPWMMVKELLVTTIETSTSLVYIRQEVTFLFLHVMAMLENIATHLGGKMTIMGTLLGGFGVV